MHNSTLKTDTGANLTPALARTSKSGKALRRVILALCVGASLVQIAQTDLLAQGQQGPQRGKEYYSQAVEAALPTQAITLDAANGGIVVNVPTRFKAMSADEQRQNLNAGLGALAAYQDTKGSGRIVVERLQTNMEGKDVQGYLDATETHFKGQYPGAKILLKRTGTRGGTQVGRIAFTFPNNGGSMYSQLFVFGIGQQPYSVGFYCDGPQQKRYQATADDVMAKLKLAEVKR